MFTKFLLKLLQFLRIYISDSSEFHEISKGFNHLSAIPTKWSNTLKQFISNLLKNFKSGFWPYFFIFQGLGGSEWWFLIFVGYKTPFLLLLFFYHTSTIFFKVLSLMVLPLLLISRYILLSMSGLLICEL